MPKYQIYIDRPLPDEEAIRSTENFEQLLAQTLEQGGSSPGEPARPGAAQGWLKIVSLGAVISLALLASWFWVDRKPLVAESANSAAGAAASMQLPFLALSGHDTLFPQEGFMAPRTASLFLSGDTLPADFPAHLPKRWVKALNWQGEPTVTWHTHTEAASLQGWYWFEGNWKSVTPVIQPRLAPETALPSLSLPESPRPEPPRRAFGLQVSQSGAPSTKVTYWEYVPGPYSVDPWLNDLLGEEQAWEDIRAEHGADGISILTFSKTTPQGAIVRKSVRAMALLNVHSQAGAEAIVNARNQAYQNALAAWEAAERNRDSVHRAQEAASRSLRSHNRSKKHLAGTWVFPLRNPGFYVITQN